MSSRETSMEMREAKGLWGVVEYRTNKAGVASLEASWLPPMQSAMLFPLPRNSDYLKFRIIDYVK